MDIWGFIRKRGLRGLAVGLGWGNGGGSEGRGSHGKDERNEASNENVCTWLG
jgi:hypothetical protein